MLCLIQQFLALSSNKELNQSMWQLLSTGCLDGKKPKSSSQSGIQIGNGATRPWNGSTWGWMVNYVSLTVEKLWKFVLLTKLGRDSCSVCSPALLEGQLLYRGSDAHLLLVCSTHQLVTQKTKLPSVSQVQFPKQRKQKEKPHVSF